MSMPMNGVYWNTPTSIESHILGWPSTVAALSGYGRDQITYKASCGYCLALYKKSPPASGPEEWAPVQNSPVSGERGQRWVWMAEAEGTRNSPFKRTFIYQVLILLSS